jgi:hypothetical protein
MFNAVHHVSEKSYLWWRFSRLFLCAITLGCMLVCLACGRKALPAPVAAVAPPVIKGLQAKIEGDELKLTWPVPEWKTENEDQLAGFRVYRSLEDLAVSTCEDCPRRFQKAAELNIGKTGAGEDVFYTEPVKKGFRYFYRVSCYTDDDVEGESSETVTITP